MVRLGLREGFSRSSNAIYGCTEGRGLIKLTGTMLATTLGLLLGIVLILICLVLDETVVSGLLGPIAEPFLMDTFLPVWAWVKWPVILALLIALITVRYYVTPNVRQPKFRWISLGSVVAITGIILVAGALYLYFLLLDGYSSYGALGGCHGTVGHGDRRRGRTRPRAAG